MSTSRSSMLYLSHLVRATVRVARQALQCFSLCGALGAAVSPAAGQCEVTLTPQTAIGTILNTGSIPSGITIADFNKDGTQDVAVSNRNSSTISVFRVISGGSFGFLTTLTSVISPPLFQPSALATGDFNRDGNLDLAVNLLTNGGVGIMLGDGVGNFGAPTLFLTGSTPADVVAVDMDRDGTLDLVVTNQNSNTVSVLKGNGAGSFAAAVNVAAPSSPQDLATGDLNRDGIPDIVLLNVSANQVSVYFGTLTGNLGAATTYATSTGPRDVALLDVDSDGDLDIVVVGATAGVEFAVHTNNGSGVLAIPRTTYQAESASGSLGVADFNTDGRPDVLRAGLVGSASVFAGGTPPSVGAFTEQAPIVIPNDARELALGDLNRDGRTDAVVLIQALNQCIVLLNTTDCTPAVQCQADFNGVDGLTTQDLFDFLNAWFAGCP